MTNEPTWFKRLLELNPLLVRGVFVSFIGLLGAVGITVSGDTVQIIIGFVVSVFALVTALWGAPAVTPNAKVLAYQPDPYIVQGEVLSGGAVVGADQAAEVVAAATTTS